MATSCKVYLNDGLPIDVRNAHRILYFPDGSAHIFDKNDRPVFIAAPGRFSCVVMDYAVNETVDEKQRVPSIRQKQPPVHGGAVVPVQPQRTQEPPAESASPQWQRAEKFPPGFPPVGESKPAEHPTPGEVKITSLQQRGPDGETTHEMNIPTAEVVGQDFPTAPQTAGQQ